MTHGIGRALPTHELKKVFSESEMWIAARSRRWAIALLRVDAPVIASPRRTALLCWLLLLWGIAGR
jgi:hypothetical protein